MDPWAHAREYSPLMQCLFILTFLQIMLWRLLASILGILMNTDMSIMLKLLQLYQFWKLLWKITLSSLKMFTENQISCTAIGKPPALLWATIYEEIHDDEYIHQWTTYVKFVRSFIDNWNAIWDPPVETSDEESNIKYDKFKAVVNNNKGLTWEFTELSNSVNFLDLTLTILPDGNIKTKLSEKPLSLHLYILPHSIALQEF